MSCYLIGCLHIGHESMARYRGFNSADEHDMCLLENWNSIVSKRDAVWILGDVTMETPKHYSFLNLLKGEKKVVLGNHDKWQDVPELLKYVNGVAGMVDYKGYALTHAPIHVSEIGQYLGNIHAHIHHENKLKEVLVNKKYDDVEDNPMIFTGGKYFNVDAHLIEYKPKTIEQLIELNK